MNLSSCPKSHIYVACKDIPCELCSVPENIYNMSTNNTSFTKGIRF